MSGSGDIDPRLLKAAVEATGAAILITTAELDEPGPRIEYANSAFVRLTGYHLTEIIGRSPRFLQGPRTERAELDRARASLEAGDAFQGETLNYRKDGSTYMVEWLITPVREADGRVTHWVSAQRDVTDRRAFEDRQAMMVRELHHRVKNTLATVQAVLNATMRSAVSLPEFGRAFTGRIASLARTHALITEDQAQVASFEGLLRAELDPYNENDRITLRGPDLRASFRTRGAGRHGVARAHHQRPPSRGLGASGRPGLSDVDGGGSHRCRVAGLNLERA
ncbi:HWE histidine kinase domain-containing protein [Methylobacterium sp. J-090]|uniref:HWE histidine kinase domain-containing protein n=1 Tax=Methylobacterium sp. J-090 TaxID=2836666 RepID=UPI001FBBAEC4|nr:HWE histidine kinase domain-containing protein [Methylobacterium sp. J-090]MCJ2083507.1 PAS domain-containing protein [Methylobacterium sp. J-090]